MASRPFATINVALETEEEPPDLIGGNVKVSRTQEIFLFPSWGVSADTTSPGMTDSPLAICFTATFRPIQGDSVRRLLKVGSP